SLQRLNLADDRFRVEGGVDRSGDVSRRDDVHAYTALGELDGRAATEVDDGRLRRSVRGETDARADAGDRCHVDDRAALTAPACGLLRADHHAIQIDLHDAMEVTQIVVHEPPERRRDAGVVDHHVERAEPVDSAFDDGPHAVDIGDVRVLENRNTAKRAGG